MHKNSPCPATLTSASNFVPPSNSSSNWSSKDHLLLPCVTKTNTPQPKTPREQQLGALYLLVGTTVWNCTQLVSRTPQRQAAWLRERVKPIDQPRVYGACTDNSNLPILARVCRWRLGTWESIADTLQIRMDCHYEQVPTTWEQWWPHGHEKMSPTKSPGGKSKSRRSGMAGHRVRALHLKKYRIRGP